MADTLGPLFLLYETMILSFIQMGFLVKNRKEIKVLECPPFCVYVGDGNFISLRFLSRLWRLQSESFNSRVGCLGISKWFTNIYLQDYDILISDRVSAYLGTQGEEIDLTRVNQNDIIILLTQSGSLLLTSHSYKKFHQLLSEKS